MVKRKRLYSIILLIFDSPGAYDFSWKTGKIAGGIYFLALKERDKTTQTQKFIVIR